MSDTEQARGTVAGMDREYSNLSPKWLVNGFPKAGLHFAEMFISPLAKPMPPGQLHVRPFVGTFAGNSFTEEWVDVPLFMYNVSRLKPNHYFWSHIGHQEAIEAFLYYLGVAHIVTVRDLRDVAVSQAYHVTMDNDHLAHADKELYQDMGSFDDVLMAVIQGVGRYSGVMARWQYWAPWFEADWVYPFRFEQALSEPEVVAREILDYAMGRTSEIFGLNLEAPGPALDALVEKMVESAGQQERSVTFRKGEAGGWRKHFTEDHKRAFKATDTDDWLIKLGYESSRDW